MSIYTTRERQRIEAVERSRGCAQKRLGLLNALAEATAAICATPLAAINLVDTEWLHAVGTSGLTPGDLRRAEGFCGTLAEGLSPTLVVEDATCDDRFWHLEVVQNHGIRFYAGAQLNNLHGDALGALRVLDDDARVFSVEARVVLATIGKLVTSLIDPDRRPAPTTPEGQLLRTSGTDRIEMLRLIDQWAHDPGRREVFGPDRLARLHALTHSA